MPADGEFAEGQSALNEAMITGESQPVKKSEGDRCAQEALNNARKLSQAKHVDLSLNYQNDGVEMVIEDNGMGFNLPLYLTDLADSGHYGLMGIQECVNQLDGTLEISSNPGKGTQLSLYIPSEPAPQPEDAVSDPVCSAHIQPQQAYASTFYEGTYYYFCCPICQGAFQKEPERYANHQGTSCTHAS